MQLGRWVEGKLEERDAKGKPKHSITNLLDAGFASGNKATGQKHDSMSHLVTKTMKIPESGVW